MANKDLSAHALGIDSDPGGPHHKSTKTLFTSARFLPSMRTDSIYFSSPVAKTNPVNLVNPVKKQLLTGLTGSTGYAEKAENRGA